MFVPPTTPDYSKEIEDKFSSIVGKTTLPEIISRELKDVLETTYKRFQHAAAQELNKNLNFQSVISYIDSLQWLAQEENLIQEKQIFNTLYTVKEELWLLSDQEKFFDKTLKNRGNHIYGSHLDSNWVENKNPIGHKEEVHSGFENINIDYNETFY